MPDNISIRPMILSDIDLLFSSFKAHSWLKPRSIFEQYWQEQIYNDRKIWLAFYENKLAGYITLKWKSLYKPFSEKSIPEITDLNVLPPFRNKGLGSLLLSTAENEANQKSEIVGLGVGLYSNYGIAQKLYIKKGYMPDGQGITYQYASVKPGNSAILDDDLVLWFTKALQPRKELQKSEEGFSIHFVDQIDQTTEKQMAKDLVAYESSRGVNVNYRQFAITLSNEQKKIFGVLKAYTAFAEIYIDDLWIDNAYRRKGYGRQLIQALENHFKSQGFNNINLVTSAFQAPEFYKKCGFIEEFIRTNKKNPQLTKTFFVKFFNEKSENQGILK